MRLGRWFGVPLVLNNYFLLLILALIVLGQGKQAGLLFLAVLVHEFGHALSARQRGLLVREVEVLPFGGVAKVDDLLEVDPRVEAQVALMGPLVNAAASFFTLLLRQYHLIPGEEAVFFLRCNLAVAVFNLLPALPLDGGRILRSSLVGKYGFRRATATAAKIGQGLAVLGAVVGTVGLYQGWGNPSVVVLAFFVYYAAQREQRLAGYVLLRYLTRKKQEIHGKKVIPVVQLVASGKTPLREVIRAIVPQRYHLVLLLDEECRVTGYLTEVELIDAYFNRGTDLPLEDLPVHHF